MKDYTRIDQINWLRRYCMVWDFVEDEMYLESIVASLCDALKRWCEDQGLPYLSADELLYELEHQEDEDEADKRTG